MELEEALKIIEEHSGDVRRILERIRDRDILKHLMRTESFSDMVIDYFSKHPKAPGADVLLEIYHEILEEEAQKYYDMDKEISKFKETARIYQQAREKYLLSFRIDPLASLFIRKLRLTPLKGALLGFLLVCLTYITGIALYFLLNKPIAGVTMTGIDFLFDFSLIPLVFGYYVWISSKAGYLFLEFKKRGVKLEREQDFDNFAANSVNNFINHRFWPIASAAVTVTLIAITCFIALTYSTVWGPREANYALLCFWKVPVLWGLSWYMVCIIFIKETATIIALRRLLKKERLSLNPFHKDRHGGLKPIVDYAMNFTYFVMACGYGFILLFIRSWKFEYFYEDIFVNLGLLLYLGLACFFFFFPLSPAHRLVKKLIDELPDKETIAAKLLPLSPLRPAAVFKFASVAVLPIIAGIIIPILRLTLNK